MIIFTLKVFFYYRDALLSALCLIILRIKKVKSETIKLNAIKESKKF